MPPILRMSRKNIVLSCLFVGFGAQNWNEIVPRLRAELFSPIEVFGPDFPKITTSFKVRLLVTDLVAKPHVLNTMQFNGYFGCHFGTAEGITIGRAHAYCPHNQSGSIRETTLHCRYVEAAELRSATSSASCFVVKGQSAFSDVVSGLPLTAPIDYMHCILLGVFPELLKHLLKKMAPTYRKETKDLVPSPNCPRELITYSRKIRSLDEINQFKANEFFNWLFYLSPVVFWKRIPKVLYDNLLSFVFGVRLLLEFSKEENVVVAERLLNQFCSSVVEIFDGNERVETIHSLRHLPTHVRRFGPLFAFSAMSFESANRILSEVFTGSHYECEVVCRPFLQRQRLLDLHNKSEESVFGGLVRQLLR